VEHLREMGIREPGLERLVAGLEGRAGSGC
jgi:hypothetical protein